jgi:hypothetical protein
MIMPRASRELLLPANPVFIWFTLALALAANLMPLGRHPALPDLLALTLVFWNVHQPLRVGVGAAFVFGLFMDVHDAALLGQHALAYTLLSFFAITIHRRLLWFSVLGAVAGAAGAAAVRRCARRVADRAHVRRRHVSGLGAGLRAARRGAAVAAGERAAARAAAPSAGPGQEQTTVNDAAKSREPERRAAPKPGEVPSGDRPRYAVAEGQTCLN